LTGGGRTGPLLFRVLALGVLFFPGAVLSRGEDGPGGPDPAGPGLWYVSNGAGMALERAWSRLAALRNPYCLLVEERPPAGIPELLGSSYQEPWAVELRTLYKDGEESRRQWIFRDGEGLPRVVAVFEIPPAEAEPEAEGEAEGAVEPLAEGENGAEADGAAESLAEGEGAAEDAPPPGNRAPTGFIELYGENGLISLDRQLSGEGDELVTGYTYNRVSRDRVSREDSPPGRELLIRADTWRIFPAGEGEEGREDISTDYYRYTRNLSLRSIERVYHREAPAPEGEEGESRTTLRFPRRSLDSAAEEGFVSPALAYGSQFLDTVQSGVFHRVVYTTDERGRILEETRQDEEGNIITEIRNIWSGSHLSRVIVKTGEDERITEYEYNHDGDRIKEQNYYNGILERIVYFRGDLEDEELYMDGELILRSQWEGGRKLREERVRPRRTRPENSPAGTAEPVREES
jgi:hypothetical protein